MDSADSWLNREVPLSQFKRRTVLLTLAVEEQTQQDVGPTHTDPPSLFELRPDSLSLSTSTSEDTKTQGSGLKIPITDYPIIDH